MKSLNRSTKCTGLVLILIVSQFILPIAGGPLATIFNNAPTAEKSLNKVDLNLNEAPSGGVLTTTQENKKIKNSIFGNDLQEHLNNLSANELNSKNRIKVLIEFEKGTQKQKRVDIINSIFGNFRLIDNYNSISTSFLEVDTVELIEKGDQLQQEEYIKKVYKSKTYDTPVITDIPLGTSALSEDNFPNWWIPAIGADNLDYDGSGVSVAILDTGIHEHPDLNIINRSDFATYGGGNGDLYGHGTHAAGIIGSNGDSSGDEYRGVAPEVSLIDAQAGNVSGGLLDGDIIKAIEWASKPIGEGGAEADIISMSFGAGIFDANPLIWETISTATRDHGTIFVASAGNSGQNFYTGGTPATHPDVISVGATNRDNELASFSSCGPSLSYIGFPDVVAPGVNIISTSAVDSILEKEKKYIGDYFDSGYIPLSGTSMSCPAVSGAIAVLKDAFPDIKAETARIALYEGATRLSDPEEAYITRSGAGLINVSASLDFLSEINSTQSNINNITDAFPENLPAEPFDLLNFPGDSQQFNLTIPSGLANTVGIEVPTNIEGIELSLTNENLVYSQYDTKFTTLTIEIKENATIGPRNFLINLTIDGKRIDYASINVSIDVRFPEQRVLFESYHGLNDWLEDEYTYAQIGFYEAMADMRDLNISVDYYMEYWRSNYDKGSDNYILTEERLAQYDLIVLQNPVLPYSPLEIENLVEYHDSGGHILYLGKRYQHVCSESLNTLFTELGLDTQIQEQNIISEEYVGLGSLINYLDATPKDSPIFNGVDKFLWGYGHSFDLSGNSNAIAEIDNRTVAVANNGSNSSKGRFIGFGDLSWLYYDYSAEEDNYAQEHKTLLTNMMEYFFDSDDLALNIELSSERTSSGELNITAYAKNTTSDQLIDSSTLNNQLTMSINNSGSYEEILLNSQENGIAINHSYSIPSFSAQAYEITINLTLGSTTYTKTSKVLYYDSSSVPEIDTLSTNPSSVNKGGSIDLEANMYNPGYPSFNGYISLYSYGFHNSEKTLNETQELSSSGALDTTYSKSFNVPTAPSGYGIFYVIPENSNYITPNSPRQTFKINNYAPRIYEDSSYVGSKQFSDTVDGEQLIVQQATQGDQINFKVDAQEQVTGSGEDIESQLTVSVSFFMVVISEEVDGTSSIILMFPSTFITTILDYNNNSDKHEGSIIIPNSMEFNSIKGNIDRSTVPSNNPTSDLNYLSLLYVNVMDSEGGPVEDPFYIAYYLNPAPDPIPWAAIIIGLLVVAGIIGLAIIIYSVRKDKIHPEGKGEARKDSSWETNQWDEKSYYSEQEPYEAKPDTSFHCPFCGRAIETPKRYCPGCGKALDM